MKRERVNLVGIMLLVAVLFFGGQPEGATTPQVTLVNQDGQFEIQDSDDILVQIEGGNPADYTYSWERNGIELKFADGNRLTNKQMKTFTGNPLEYTPASNHTDHAIRGYEYGVTVYEGSDLVATASTEIRGPRFVAPNRAVVIATWDSRANSKGALQKSLEKLREAINPNWLEIFRISFQDKWGSPNIFAKTPGNGLMTLPDDMFSYLVGLAHEMGMKVAYVPQLWLQNPRDILSGRSEFTPEPGWYDAYVKWISHEAEVSEASGVELFSIGAETDSTLSNDAFWLRVIAEVRNRYSGQITYAPITCCFAAINRLFSVDWFSKLDVLGVAPNIDNMPNAGLDPTLSQLTDHYREYASLFEKLSQRFGKDVYALELSWFSTDGIAHRGGSNEDSRTADWQEQADIYGAAFRAFNNQPWLAGTAPALWPPLISGVNDRGYELSPAIYQKPASKVIQSWYDQSNPVPQRDMDGDGVLDQNDYCPNYPGSVEANGC